MTPELIAAAAAVGAVVLLLVGGLLLRRRGTLRIENPEEAAAAAERAVPGFVVAGAVVGADGGGALAVSDRGRVAAIARRGRRLLAREVTWRAVRSGEDGVVVETDDRRLGDVLLAGVDVLDIRRLAPGARVAG